MTQQDTVLGTGDAVASLAAELNEDVAKIRVRDAMWTRFANEGLTVSITVGFERFRVGLTLEELGMSPEDEKDRKALARILKPGSRSLISQDEIQALKSLEDEARGWLRKCAYRTHWGYWLHKSQYLAWREGNEPIRARFVAVAESIVARWDAIVEQAKLDYLVLAAQTYNNLLASPAVRAGRVELPLLEEFTREFVDRSLARLPRSGEAILQKLRYDVSVDYLPLAQQVAADQAKAQQIRLDAAEAAMLADIKATEARRAAGGIAQLVGEVQEQIRGRVYQVAVDALDSLKRGDGRLGRNTTKALKNLVEQVSTTVFWEDPDLDRRIAEIGRLVEIDSDKRSESEVREALQALGAEARITLLELDRVGERRARPDLGITDDLGDLERVARRARPEVALLGDLDLAEAAPRHGRGRRRAVALEI